MILLCASERANAAAGAARGVEREGGPRARVDLARRLDERSWRRAELELGGAARVAREVGVDDQDIPAVVLRSCSAQRAHV